MIHREFLGWRSPFLSHVADWLLQRRDALPRTLVLVPTSQAGRRVKEALAERAGALLAPRFRTPGSLLQTPDPAVAAPWAEQFAWVASLQTGALAERFPELFPDAEADEDLQWVPGFARELVRLRRRLQEAGHTIGSAADCLGGMVHGGPWGDLAELERLMSGSLTEWGLRGRNEELRRGIRLPEGVSAIVLAGVTEMAPCLQDALRAASMPVSVLVAAPADECGCFSDLGIPGAEWKERFLPWPEEPFGSVATTAGPRDQAQAAYQRVCAAGRASDDVALGSADPETAAELERVFTHGGWTAFNPSRALPVTGLFGWMLAWAGWLRDGSIRAAADLLVLPETAGLIRGDRMEALASLHKIREKRVLVRSDDIHRAVVELEKGTLECAWPRPASAAVGQLEHWRGRHLGGSFAPAMLELLRIVGQGEPELADAMRDWLEAARVPMEVTQLSAASCIDLMLSHLPSPTALPPDGRVIDVQGWLELMFEPGGHLVLCGMNEGRIPPESAPDPWLNESVSRRLGLPSRDDRVARDAFLFASLVESRRGGGRVDVLCAKTAASGDPLAPSRLLLASPDDDLARRVEVLFRDVVPMDAGLVWEPDFRWRPRLREAPSKIRVTNLREWIACPFRFYIRHVLGASAPTHPEPQWSAAMAGTVVHEVMERWGRDKELSALENPTDLEESLHGIFGDLLEEQFGGAPPVAVRIQAEAIRQRLSWVAQAQARHFAEGWRVESCEVDFHMLVGGVELGGRVDRIDRGDDGQVLVIDYKTGGSSGTMEAHRKRVSSRFAAAHLPADCPVFHEVTDLAGGIGSFRWIDLQLPLYAAQLCGGGSVPIPGYFLIGDTKAKVGVEPWRGFAQADIDAALRCAEWVVGRISSGVFWPPAAKVPYDSLEAIAMKRGLESVVHEASAELLRGGR